MEINNPLVSICIPVYNHIDYVKRLFDSIIMQDYKNIEVIVSDDSSEFEIENLCEQYKGHLLIRYFNHKPSLKSPKNWNFALDQASGDYLMLIHQDDYFAKSSSLNRYLDEFRKNQKVAFVFSRNTPMYDNGKFVPNVPHDKKIINNLKKNVDFLIDDFVIGPPSNVMISRKIKTRYDERFIWLVDVDYFVRIIETGIEYSYIDEHLVTIGMHDNQTTVFCYENPQIMLKENILYAQKRPLKVFRKLLVFDYFWRLIRNHKVKSLNDLQKIGIKYEEINLPLKHIIEAQEKFSYKTLKNGFVSKLLMLKTLLRHQHQYS
ncbi:MAG TPA: glycosyltransferase family 2 protein [Hanamia sp.]|nr:glycosyltransferase family 2 protein [Hanamia sp.]